MKNIEADKELIAASESRI